MSTQVQRRRGTEAENDAFTGALGEITVLTDADRIAIHDASTQGGHELPNERDVVDHAFNYAATGGSQNALTATIPYTGTVPKEGVSVVFKPHIGNTTLCTLAVNGDTARYILKRDPGTATHVHIANGDLITGGIYEVFYLGGSWILASTDASTLSEASQAEMEAQSAVAKYVPPDLVKHSPGVAKVVGNITGTTINHNIGISSATSSGLPRVTFSTAFSNANYVAICQCRASTTSVAYINNQTTGYVDLHGVVPTNFNSFQTANLPSTYNLACWGDQ